MPETPEQLAAILSDRYRIQRQLGQGGMATVYLADDLKLERQVALKVLRPELGAVLGTERFLAEVKITARLDHPHILTLIDSGSVGGILYYVLPYVRGESLRDLLDRDQQLGVERALEITKHIASALDYAHRNGVVHRDIKPENILLQEGEAMLADFGIALAVKEAGGNRLTETGLSLGTPQYMSPEQATGDRVLDARSDVYSLAAVLYEMLVGDPPITGKTVQSVIAKLLTEPPTRIRTVRPTVAEGIDAAVARALSKVPADRFASAGDFMRALEAATATAANAAAVNAAATNASLAMPSATGAISATPHRKARNVGIMIGAAATVTLLVVLGANGKLFGKVDTSAALREKTQLTFTGRVSAPTVSADGKQLAYYSKECTGATCTYAIDVQDVGATVTRRVLEGASAGYGLEWSPDRRNLIMTGTVGGRYGTYLLSALGGTPRFLSLGPATFYAGGDSVLFSSGEPMADSNFVVRVRSVNGGGGDSVIVPGPGLSLATLVSVPGTSRFVATVIRPPRGLWRVMDRSGKLTDELLNDCTCGGMASQDALWMARAGPTIAEAIVRVALDGATGKLASHQDTIYSGRFSNLSVTADGQRLTVDDGSYDNTVVALELPALLRGTMPSGEPLMRASSPVLADISPDGKRLLMVRRVPGADGAEERRLSIRAFDGGNETPLTVPGRVSATRWVDSVTVQVRTASATGAHFALVDVRTGSAGRTRDFEGAPPADVAPLVNGWVWVHPGRDRIVIEQDGRTLEVKPSGWFQNLIGLDVSPDGARISYFGWNRTTGDTIGVEVVPTAGGPAVLWARHFAEFGGAQFMADGSLTFASWTGPESMTLLKVTSPGAATVLGTLPVRASDFSVSDDYKRATISWSDQRTDAWMYRVVKP